MDTEAIGLWLIGIGSLLLVVAVFFSTPDKFKGLRFETKHTTRSERLIFATQACGLLFAGAGSLTIALAQSLSSWVIGLTVLALLLVYDVVLAWVVKRAWSDRLRRLQELAAQGTEIPAWQLQIANRRVTWRWCLSHPLTRHMTEQDD